jgi:UDP-3-O-[3-hydroxymyristoyl] glucosamine N-acyltransferase
MIAILNIFGKGNWSTKITSLLISGDWAEYDESNYDSAPGKNKWIIAEENGFTREKIALTYLDGVTYETLFKGLDDLDGVTYGDGLVVGPGSLIRPTTVIGNQVYIGAGTIIDIDCVIGDGVTIGDNVTITAGSLIEAGSIIKSGSII